MARKFLKRILPEQSDIEQSKVLKALGPWVLHPAVWSLHRRSVAGGVAAGLFCGLFPAPFQMLGAAMASFLFHWNLPVAVFTTLYTNPLTFIPLYVVALKLGIVVLNAVLPKGHHAATGSAAATDAAASDAAFPPPPDFDWTQPIQSSVDLGQWALGMGWPLLVGVFLLALILAISGYIVTRIGWNVWVRYEVIQRRKRRTHH